MCYWSSGGVKQLAGMVDSILVQIATGDRCATALLLEIR
jgi:hypothetical protein